MSKKIAIPSVELLPRGRISQRTRDLAASGLGLVHGAAGIGKTSALVEVSREWHGPVAWVRLDAGDETTAGLVRLIEAALGIARSHVRSIDDLISSIEAECSEHQLLVLDDLHAIHGTEAAQDLRRLLRYRPHNLTVFAASRYDPRCDDVHRVFRMTGMCVDSEDLRFRLWEVDELMRTQFDLLMSPSDLHLLSRYTDGWAAALSLFAVAARDATPKQRTQMIAGMRTTPSSLHRILTEEMLKAVPAPHRDLLTRTSVFEFLTPQRCDELLDTSTASALLRDIHARGLFNDVDESVPKYAFHDLVRSFLISELSESTNYHEVNDLHIRAGQICEAESALGEAIRYYARGDDLDAATRVMSARGDELAEAHGTWWESLPDGIGANDPFVQVALARRAIRSGSLRRAERTYERAVDLLDSERSLFPTIRSELQTLRMWLGEPQPGGGSWIVGVRTLLDVPLSDRKGGDLDPFTDALDSICSGRFAEAATKFERGEPLTAGMTHALALFGRVLCQFVLGGPESTSESTKRRLHHASKQLSSPALERLSTALDLPGSSRETFELLANEALADGDDLGAGLLSFLGGIASIFRGDPDPKPFLLAADRFESGRYARPRLAALCFAHAAGGDALASKDQAAAIAAGPVLRRLAAGDIDATTPTSSSDHGAADLLELLRRGSALGERDSIGTPASTRAPVGRIRLLGSFGVEHGSGETPTTLTPGHRRIMAYLFCRVGEWVHADTLVGLFWPDSDEARARHSLHVASSSIRKHLAELGAADVERHGDRYRLQVDGEWEVDLFRMRDLLDHSESLDETLANTLEAQAMYADPISDLGSVDWAVDFRRQLRHRVTACAVSLCERLLEAERLSDALAVAQAGLDIDRGADQLWVTAIGAAGPVRSSELRAEYDEIIDGVLADTDVTTP